MANGEVHIYDGMGGFVSKMNIQCLSNSGSANNKVVTLHWYSGKHGLVHRDAPTLAICYDNGSKPPHQLTVYLPFELRAVPLENQQSWHMRSRVDMSMIQ